MFAPHIGASVFSHYLQVDPNNTLGNQSALYACLESIDEIMAPSMKLSAEEKSPSNSTSPLVSETSASEFNINSDFGIQQAINCLAQTLYPKMSQLSFSVDPYIRHFCQRYFQRCLSRANIHPGDCARTVLFLFITGNGYTLFESLFKLLTLYPSFIYAQLAEAMLSVFHLEVMEFVVQEYCSLTKNESVSTPIDTTLKAISTSPDGAHHDESSGFRSLSPRELIESENTNSVRFICEFSGSQFPSMLKSDQHLSTWLYDRIPNISSNLNSNPPALMVELWLVLLGNKKSLVSSLASVFARFRQKSLFSPLDYLQLGQFLVYLSKLINQQELLCWLGYQCSDLGNVLLARLLHDFGGKSQRPSRRLSPQSPQSAPQTRAITNESEIFRHLVIAINCITTLRSFVEYVVQQTGIPRKKISKYTVNTKKKHWTILRNTSWFSLDEFQSDFETLSDVISVIQQLSKSSDLPRSFVKESPAVPSLRTKRSRLSQ